MHHNLRQLLFVGTKNAGSLQENKQKGGGSKDVNTYS
jgi:hypothetical protein